MDYLYRGTKMDGHLRKRRKWTEEYCRQVRESQGFDIDYHVRIPQGGIYPFVLREVVAPPSNIALYGRLGVHWFNFEMGRNLQLTRILKYNTQPDLYMSYYVTVDVVDLDDHSPHTFQTLVTSSFPMNGANFRVYTELCRLKPEKPVEGSISLLDEQAIDDSYKGCIPNFLSQPRKDYDDDSLRLYEVQEHDICENDWLRLYSDFALYAYWSYNQDAYESCLPVEIKKIVVETCETHREPRLKLKSPNAIFHINFSAKSRDYISVVRRTTDGKAGHVIFEINTCLDQPNMR